MVNLASLISETHYFPYSPRRIWYTIIQHVDWKSPRLLPTQWWYHKLYLIYHTLYNNPLHIYYPCPTISMQNLPPKNKSKTSVSILLPLYLKPLYSLWRESSKGYEWKFSGIDLWSTSRYTLNLSIFLILVPTYLCKLFLQKKWCLS